MFENMENLEIVSALFGNASAHRDYFDRPAHGLIYKATGQSRYSFPGGDIYFPQGTVLFVPEGMDYTVHKLCEEESRYGLINFHADLKDPMPRLYRLDGFADAGFLYEKFVRAWLFADPSNHFLCLSLFYELISYLLRADEMAYSDSGKKQIIAPAVGYLQEHIFDPELRTEHLHRLCGVSDTYFRKLFISEFGVSPRQYITSKRLAQAKNILSGGDYTYIYDVARSVGYTDALYFSRIFKKKYGHFPSGEQNGKDLLAKPISL